MLGQDVNISMAVYLGGRLFSIEHERLFLRFDARTPTISKRRTLPSDMNGTFPHKPANVVTSVSPIYTFNAKGCLSLP